MPDPVCAVPITSAPQRQPEPSSLLPFDDASRALREKILALKSKGAARCTLVCATPGTGKSRHALELARDLAAEGHVVLWGAPTRERRDEAVARARSIGVSTVTLEGRGPHNCPKHDVVARAAALGYEPARSVCVRCPLFPTNDPPGGPCDYYVQHDRAVAATKRRGKDNVDVVFATSDAVVAHVQHGQVAADWIVFDEDFQRPLIREVAFDAADLVRPIDGENLLAGASLLARALVRISESKPANGIVVTRELARVLCDEAEREGRSATQALMDAVADAPDYGRGALYDLRDEAWERVPDRRLADLCAEALREVSLVGDDSDRAYRLRAAAETDRATSTERWVYGFVSFAPFEFSGRVVALDAYGAASVVSRYLDVNESDPKEWGLVEVRARVADGVKVRHLRSFNGTKRRMNDDLRLRVALDRMVLPELDRLSPRPAAVAAYTWKRHERAIEDALTTGGYPPLFVKHFFQDRGDDRMRDCDTLVVVGEPRPNAAAVVHRANAVMGGARIVDGDARMEPLVAALTTQELAQILHRTRPVIPRSAGPNRILYWGRFPLPDEFAATEVDGRGPRLAEAEERRLAVLTICRRTGFWSSDLFLLVHLSGQRLNRTLSETGQLFFSDWNGVRGSLSYIESLFADTNSPTADELRCGGPVGVRDASTYTHIRAVQLGEYGRKIVNGLSNNRKWLMAVQEVCEGMLGWTKRKVRASGPGISAVMTVYGDVERAERLAARRGEFAALVQTIGAVKRSWAGTAS